MENISSVLIGFFFLSGLRISREYVGLLLAGCGSTDVMVPFVVAARVRASWFVVLRGSVDAASRHLDSASTLSPRYCRIVCLLH